jgi:DNA-binding MarR family transcriptional regulator
MSNCSISNMTDRIDKINQQWAVERPDLPTGSLGMLNRIIVLERYLNRAFARSLADVNLTVWEFDVLATLRRNGPSFSLSAGELSREMMLSAGAMTNRIDRLVGRRLVTRRPHPESRRSVTIALSTKGMELVDIALTERAVLAGKLTSALSATDLKRATSLLRSLLMSFEFREEVFSGGGVEAGDS